MWCHHCGQDVPGIASMESSDGPLRDESVRASAEPPPLELIEDAESALIRFCCARCGAVLGDDASEPTSAEGKHLAAELSAVGRDSRRPDPTVPADVEFNAWQWELDQDLHDVRHLLEARRACSQVDEDQWAVAVSDESLAPPAAAVAPTLSAHSPPVAAPATRRSPFFTWLVLSLSFMAFAGGGVLLGWSVFFNRGDLWSWGLLSALGGQAGLLFGLVLFLERLWREGRQANSQISEVDQRLGDLQHTAARNQSASPYHAHGQHSHAASPHLLVSDLKHQLDMLARQIPDSRR